MVLTAHSRLLQSISERKRSGAESESAVLLDVHAYSEDHLRFLAESLPEIVWTALPNGQHDYMNKRWFTYTGLTEYETYKESKTAIHPDDYPLYVSRWKEAVRTGKPYEIAYRFRRASDGMYRWHIGRAHPVRDHSGNIVKWFGTCVDIHAQKEAEEQIRKMNQSLESAVSERTKDLRKEVRQRRRAEVRYREHLELLHRMVDMFPMAAVAMDARGALLHGNERFYDLFAIDREHFFLTAHSHFGVLNLVRRRFPHADKQKNLHEMFSSTVPVQWEVQEENGRTFSFEYIPTSEGERESGYLLLMRDVSQEKKIDTAKSEFMSLASHQLRTPLTSIRWALSRLTRLLEGRLNESEKQLLQRARKSSMTMTETISTMLSISRIEAGLHPMNAIDLRVDEFLQGIWQNFSELCAERNIAFSLDCPPGVRLHTDPAMLREIVENLLNNAIKYTPEEGFISMNVEKKNGRVQIAIRDTGYGIPEHEQQKVFSKFFRGENVSKIDTQGTGLGLYLVSRLVSALGGTITFTSEEGKGTEFLLQIR